MVYVSAAVLLLLIVLFAANPEFVKEHPIPVVIGLLLAGWRLVSWIVTRSRETAADAAIAVKREETSRAVAASGSGGAVYVYRLSSFVGAVNSVVLECDGAPAANLKNGSYALLQLPAGSHTLRNPVAQHQIQIDVADGSEQYVRFNYRKGTFDLLQPDVARPEIGKLTRVA